MVQINSNASRFEDLARKYSDCSSAMKGGDLGVFKRGVMQPAFENAAYVIFRKFAPSFS
jgi:NIMA-interacting peptidyl-prolyl cis-trans isomerase 1